MKSKMTYDDYDIFTEHKCAICEKIGKKTEASWQFAANLPFHYICGPACAEELKAMQERDKEERERLKKMNKSNK